MLAGLKLGESWENSLPNLALFSLFSSEGEILMMYRTDSVTKISTKTYQDRLNFSLCESASLTPDVRYYCKFGKFCEGFIFAKLHRCEAQ